MLQAKAPPLDKRSVLNWRARQIHRGNVLSRRIQRLGGFLPFPLCRGIAKINPWLGYLCGGRGEFIIRDYYDSLSVVIDVNSSTERHMLTGKYEPVLWDAISRLISPGFHCLDVGANVGAITLPLARAVGPTGHVLALEPGPKFFDRLGKNLSLNEPLSRNVSLHRVGLSDQEGTLFWAEDPAFPGNARVSHKSGLPVPVTTLDLFLRRNPVPKLDFIKIDVEGMEYEVLKGAEESLKAFGPALLFESSLAFESIRGSRIREKTEAFLRALGYELYSLSGRPCSYPNLDENSVAIKRGKSAVPFLRA